MSYNNQNGFLKTVSSFEYFEEEIKKYYDKLNKQLNYVQPLLYYNEKYLSKYSIYFFIVASVLTISQTTISSLLIYDELKNIKFSTIELSLYYIYVFLTTLVFIDVYTILYFISVNMLLINNQVDGFHRYLVSVIEKSVQKKIECNIESIRRFNDDLYEHVKIADGWICYYYGILYLFTIPMLCVLIYSVLASIETGLELVKVCLPLIIIFIYTLVLITIIAVMVNAKVNLENLLLKSINCSFLFL